MCCPTCKAKLWLLCKRRCPEPYQVVLADKFSGGLFEELREPLLESFISEHHIYSASPSPCSCISPPSAEILGVESSVGCNVLQHNTGHVAHYRHFDRNVHCILRRGCGERLTTLPNFPGVRESYPVWPTQFLSLFSKGVPSLPLSGSPPRAGCVGNATFCTFRSLFLCCFRHCDRT